MASAAWMATSRGVIVLASSVTGRPPPGARQAPDEKRSRVRCVTFRFGWGAARKVRPGASRPAGDLTGRATSSAPHIYATRVGPEINIARPTAVGYGWTAPGRAPPAAGPRHSRVITFPHKYDAVGFTVRNSTGGSPGSGRPEGQ